jgi:hypothetical protein
MRTILLGRHGYHGNVDDMTEPSRDLAGVRALVTDQRIIATEFAAR